MIPKDSFLIMGAIKTGTKILAKNAGTEMRALESLMVGFEKFKC